MALNADSQQNSGSGWIVKNPFEHNVFIENKGQFTGKEQQDIGQYILYYSRKGKLHLYFTNTGLTFRYDSIVNATNEETVGEEKDEKENLKVMPLFVTMNWEGANTNATVEVQEPVSDYFTYPNPASMHSGIKAHAWKKIIYHNLYNGIDVEFYYPNKGGIEYDIIVHPGADPSIVKMHYSGNSHIKLIGNDVHILSPFTTFIDHAPTAIDGNKKTVATSFSVNSNTVSFNVGSYDKSKTLTIDPWFTTLTFAGINKAYDIGYDLLGNVYVYGGTYPYQISQYNNAGTLKWTYNSTFAYSYGPGFSFYGDLTIDKRSGTSYICEGYDGGGCQVLKVSSAGIQQALFPGNFSVDEFWRMTFDYCDNQLIIAAGNTSAAFQGATLDTNLTTLNPVNILGTAATGHDMALLALDGAGKCYIGSARSYGSNTGFNNVLLQMPASNLTPTAYQVYDMHLFIEIGSVSYYPYYSIYYAGNGFNGLAANSNMVISYDGAKMRKWKPATGAIMDSVTVSGLSQKWGGLDLDCQGNIYAGNDKSISVYDSTLKSIATIPVHDSIYDLLIGNGQIYACGYGYVQSLNSLIINKPLTVTDSAPTSCGACNGKANVTITGCIQPPYTYLWSNGATTSAVTGLCAGTYTVTVNGTGTGCVASSFQDTAIFTLPGLAGFTITAKDSNPTCSRGGSITVTTVGGAKPYTYLWSNGNTSSSDTGLLAGKYTITVTDNNGCKTSTTVTLVTPGAPTITVAPKTDSICATGKVALTAKGGVTYSWLPTTGLSCTNCPNPTASPAVTTTYTVTGDSGGCSNTATTTITVFPIPALNVTPPKDSACPGGSGTFTASGATTYLWKPGGATTASITVSPAKTTTYTVTGKNAIGCSDSMVVTMTINSLPVIKVTPPKDSVCKGGSVSVTASGGNTYTWSPTAGLSCTNCASPTITPAATTTYTVTGTNVDGCSSTATVTITVNNPPIVSIAPPLDTICKGGSASLNATGAQTYTWTPGTGLSCTNCANPNASPTSAITYTVTGTDSHGCTATATSLIIVTSPAITVCCDTTIVAGGTAFIGTSALGTSYLWSPDSTMLCSTCPNTTVSPLLTTTYTVLVTFPGGCIATDSVIVMVEGCDNVWVPNSFTPNGDGKNDLFTPQGKCMLTYSLYVFDRWGSVIYHTDAAKPWDGKMNGTLVQEDTYVYLLTVTTITGNTIQRLGSVTVIR